MDSIVGSSCLEAVQGAAPADATSSLPEESWFHAAREWGFLSSWTHKWQGPRSLTCLDVFSRSQRFSKLFKKHGYKAEAYDICRDKRCDITSRSGFLILLNWGMQILG